jgi:hypothetical protein
MSSIYSNQSRTAFAHPHKNLLISMILVSLTNACANITIKPKDAELIALENFANKVTAHIFEVNPYTYEEYQNAISKEVSPAVFSLLKKNSITPLSQDQIKQNIGAMTAHHKRCLIRIDSTSFSGKATSKGLIPIEVQGTCVKTLNDISKASKFDVLYLVGTHVGTKEPIIASIEIKKFD